MNSVEVSYSGFVDNLERAFQISEINAIVLDAAKESIGSLRKYTTVNRKTGADPVQNQIDLLNNLYSSPRLTGVATIVYGQQVVLIISAFEVFMSELVRAIGNEFRALFEWPQKLNKQLNIDLLSSSATTIGDLILSIIEVNGISFQDLQSTKRFFVDYLDRELNIDRQYEENFILSSAIRHAYIHSAGIADNAFMKQIRNLTGISDYTEGQLIGIKQEEVQEFKDSFLLIGNQIKDEIVSAINDKNL